MVERESHRLEKKTPFIPTDQEMKHLRENSSFSPRELMQFLLVAEGTQPAYYESTSMLLPHYYGGTPLEDLIPFQKDYLEKGFEYFELSHHVDSFVENRQGNALYRLKVFAAKNPKAVAELQEADKQKDFGRIGRLLGYPETAVEAFLKGDEYLMSEDDMRSLIDDPTIDRFMTFRLSRASWKEELDEVKKRRDKVMELSPYLYNQIITEF